MQDRPDAQELLEALAESLFSELAPSVPRELRFKTLVAANCAAILAREAAAGVDAVIEERERLSALLQRGGPVELRELQVEVAAAFRAGELDDRWDDAVAKLRESVRAKLAVAHPGYDEFLDDGR